MCIAKMLQEYFTYANRQQQAIIKQAAYRSKAYLVPHTLLNSNGPRTDNILTPDPMFTTM